MLIKFNNQDDTCDSSYIRISYNNIEIDLNDRNYKDIEFIPDINGVMVLNLEIWTKNNYGRKGRISFVKSYTNENIIPIKLIDTPRDIECKIVSSGSRSNNSSLNNSPFSSPSKLISLSLSSDICEGENEPNQEGNNGNINNIQNDKYIITLKNKSSIRISNNELEHCIYGYFNINDSRLSIFSSTSPSRLISTDYHLQFYIKNNGENYTISSENTEILVLPNIRDQIKDSITCSLLIIDNKTNKTVYKTDVHFKVDPKTLKSFPKKYCISNQNNSQDILKVSEINKEKNLFEFKFDPTQIVTIFQPMD